MVFTRSYFNKFKKHLALITIAIFFFISCITWYIIFFYQHTIPLSLTALFLLFGKDLLLFILLGFCIYFTRHTSQIENRLLYRATHDTLTRLSNRFHFLSNTKKAINIAQRTKHHVAVFFIDLNRFKLINDSLGHLVADHLLQKVAQRLQHTVRQKDTLARLGGDEFVLLAVDLKDIQDASTIAQKCLNVFNQPFQMGTHSIFLNCSIGISVYPKDGNKSNMLLRNADIAMYHAKQKQLPWSFYQQQMVIEIHQRVKIENDLLHALEANEFILHYQPIIDLQTGKTCVIEALIRWQHPQQGLIYPDNFIPIAEEMGIISNLFFWTLRTAITQAKLWTTKQVEFGRICINLSRKQFSSSDLYKKILTILAELDFSPQQLELELTESALEKDMHLISSNLSALKDRGVSIAIDDFGTGYSNLNAIKQLPLNKLKINRSFIQHISNNADDQSLVLTMIIMAKNFKLRVVGEGVETAEQLYFLRTHGCDEAQGYYFCPPLPGSEIYTLKFN